MVVMIIKRQRGGREKMEGDLVVVMVMDFIEIERIRKLEELC